MAEQTTHEVYGSITAQDDYQVGPWGVLLPDGVTVVGIVNGTLCTNRIGVEPNATQFNAYMDDTFLATGSECKVIAFNPATNQYDPAYDPPQA